MVYVRACVLSVLFAQHVLYCALLVRWLRLCLVAAGASFMSGVPLLASRSAVDRGFCSKNKWRAFYVDDDYENEEAQPSRMPS